MVNLTLPSPILRPHKLPTKDLKGTQFQESDLATPASDINIHFDTFSFNLSVRILKMYNKTSETTTIKLIW